jgi:hypothetical protein
MRVGPSRAAIVFEVAMDYFSIYEAAASARGVARFASVFAAARAAHPPPRMPPVNPPPAHRLSAHIKEFPIAAAHENPAKQNASDQ